MSPSPRPKAATSPAIAGTAMPTILNIAVVIAEPSTSRLPIKFTTVAATIARTPRIGTSTAEPCNPNGRGR